MLSGETEFLLNTDWLTYLNLRFPRCDQSADFTPAPYSFKKPEHTALSFLFEFFQKIPRLRLVRGRQYLDDPEATYDLNALRSLTELRLTKIDSERLWGVQYLRAQLTALQCRRSLQSLYLFFGRCAGDQVESSRPWSSLQTVDCSGNGLTSMEKCLKMFPVVRKLDLSDNSIEEISHDIREMTNLVEINLNYNKILSLRVLVQLDISPALTNLTTLSVCNNMIQTLHGLECLPSLIALDVAHNDIMSFDELRRVRHLPALTKLWMDGNPIAFQKHSRARILSFFPGWDRVELDGIFVESAEERALVEHYALVSGADVSPDARAVSPTPEPMLSLIDAYLQPNEPSELGQSAAKGSSRSHGNRPPVWAKDDRCNFCGAIFTWALGQTPRHHCRLCGRSVCGKHSNHFEILPDLGQESEPQRLCDRCFGTLHRAKTVPSPPPAQATHPATALPRPRERTPSASSKGKGPRTPRRRAKSANIEDASVALTPTNIPLGSSPDGSAISAPNTPGLSAKTKKKKKKKKKRLQEAAVADDSVQARTPGKSKSAQKNRGKMTKHSTLLAEQDKLHAKVSQIFEAGGPKALAIFQAYVDEQAEGQSAEAGGSMYSGTQESDASAIGIVDRQQEAYARLGKSRSVSDHRYGLADSSEAGPADKWETDSTISLASLDPGKVLGSSTPKKPQGSRAHRLKGSRVETLPPGQVGLDDGGDERDGLSGDADGREHPDGDIESSMDREIQGARGGPRQLFTEANLEGHDNSFPGPQLFFPDHSFSSFRDPADTVLTATEEFLVDVFDRTNQTTPRIIEVQGESSLNTIEVTTGETLAMYDLTCLVECVEVSAAPASVSIADEARPTIRLSFQYGRHNRRVLSIRMEDEQSAEHLKDLLHPILAANNADQLNESMASKTKCLQCNEVFALEQGRFQDADRRCPRCGSCDVVDFFTSNLSTSLASSYTASIASRSFKSGIQIPGSRNNQGSTAERVVRATFAAGTPTNTRSVADVVNPAATGTDEVLDEAEQPVGGPVIDDTPFDCTQVDHNRKLLLDLEYLAEGERCIAALDVHVVLWRDMQTEAVAPIPGLVVASTQSLHVFGAESLDGTLTVLGKPQWAELRYFQVGLGRQSLQCGTDGAIFDFRIGDQEMFWSFARVLSEVPTLTACTIEWVDLPQMLAIHHVLGEDEMVKPEKSDE